MTITNTSTDPTSPLIVLLDAMTPGRDGGGAIVAMEKRGQAELVNSDRLPTKLGTYSDETDAKYAALGFTFGEPDPADPMFRPATLPQGWARQRSDHDMWSFLVDQHGRRRVAIFYKAAFYDRSAFMRLVSRREYLGSVLGEGAALVLDDEWLPTSTAIAVLAELRERASADAVEGDNFAERETTMGSEYWHERAAENRTEAEKAQALIDDLTPTA